MNTNILTCSCWKLTKRHKSELTSDQPAYNVMSHLKLSRLREPVTYGCCSWEATGSYKWNTLSTSDIQPVTQRTQVQNPRWHHNALISVTINCLICISSVFCVHFNDSNTQNCLISCHGVVVVCGIPRKVLLYTNN